jgi:pilus assembly protein CpaC
MKHTLAAKAGLTIAFTALIAAAIVALPGAPRADGPQPQLVAAPPVVQGPVLQNRAGAFLSLGVGKSVVVDLPRDAKDVLIANPGIANAVIRSARRAYLIGVKAGQTNIIFFDEAGRQIAAYDIEVAFDATGVRAATAWCCQARWRRPAKPSRFSKPRPGWSATSTRS